MLVDIKNLKYTYNNHTNMAKEAVKDISLGIEEGEFVALLGESGCGKSTLLSLIDGLEKPAKGTIEVNCELSMMFQTSDNQLFEQTVIQDVMYGPLNIGLNESEARTIAEDSLRIVGLNEKAYGLNPVKLSGGEKRKVALAGILAMQRPLLLLDEPTAGLDKKSAVEIMEALLKLNKQGVTIVIATQDFEFAASYAKRVVVIDEGLVVYDEKSEKVVENSEKIYSFGIEVPDIYRISSMLYKSGIIKKKNLTDAQAIFEQIGHKNDSN